MLTSKDRPLTLFGWALPTSVWPATMLTTVQLVEEEPGRTRVTVTCAFVEPLEASALGMIALCSTQLADMLIDGDRIVRPTGVAQFNAQTARAWDNICRFIAVHYKFNDRLHTPFWNMCREKTDLAGAQPIVEYFQENGPSRFWELGLIGLHDQFGSQGYFALLLGQKLPYRESRPHTPDELGRWNAHRRKMREQASRAMTVSEALASIRAPGWKWPSQPA